VKVAARAETEGEAETVTLEVSHEALLRRWPTLAKLLDEDRNDVLLLDGVLQAAIDWEKAEADRKTDDLTHRASRLSDAQALKSRGYDWEREIAPASDYLVACQARQDAERQEKEAALEQEQARLAEIAAAQAKTTRLQQRARWTLAIFAALVIAGIVLVYRQHAANLDLSASLEANQHDAKGWLDALGFRLPSSSRNLGSQPKSLGSQSNLHKRSASRPMNISLLRTAP
jgi:hypothetical protein